MGRPGGIPTTRGGDRVQRRIACRAERGGDGGCCAGPKYLFPVHGRVIGGHAGSGATKGLQTRPCRTCRGEPLLRPRRSGTPVRNSVGPWVEPLPSGVHAPEGHGRDRRGLIRGMRGVPQGRRSLIACCSKRSLGLWPKVSENCWSFPPPSTPLTRFVRRSARVSVPGRVFGTIGADRICRTGKPPVTATNVSHTSSCRGVVFRNTSPRRCNSSRNAGGYTAPQNPMTALRWSGLELSRYGHVT